MRVLIVAKTRQGTRACIGGIDADGRSVRLMPVDPVIEERSGHQYQVGEVWEIEAMPDPHVRPPHTENILVVDASRVRVLADPTRHILRYMPPVRGGPEALYEGLARARSSGALIIAADSGLPGFSTQFWLSDQPLIREHTRGKRVRYHYADPAGPSLVFVGFQDPTEVLPAGTLLRVSLAHWWRARDRPGDQEVCHVQLSGWFGEVGSEPMSCPGVGAREAADLLRARGLLKRVFGYDSFRPLQEKVIQDVLAQRDALLIMPTGGGKSLCYQLPGLLLEGLTVVVSPLISLMQDQVESLRAMGVRASYLNSSLDHQTYVQEMDAVRGGETRLLYVAPETLLRPEIQLLIQDRGVACLAVDEAHCISSWGHDFRPEYRQLGPLRRRMPGSVCLALTASATPRVRDDIREILGIPAGKVYTASFQRENLFLAAEQRQRGFGQLEAFLKDRGGQCGIVYCSTRARTEEIAEHLRRAGHSALAYHAGMDERVRRAHQRAFSRDEADLIVATIAFGMGINKPNVRFVLHHDMPASLESYYQEIGRSGRDGAPADCLLLYSSADMVLSRRHIEQGDPGQAVGRSIRLGAMFEFAETLGCRRRVLLPYFGEEWPHENCGQCDNCRSAGVYREMEDVTDLAVLFLRLVGTLRSAYGPAHLIAILRGSRAARVLQWRHHEHELHGSGKAASEEKWRSVVRQLVGQGLLVRDQAIGVVRLGSAADAVLHGRATVNIPRVRELPSATTDSGSAPGDGTGYDAALFERLRRLRQELAAQAGVPAFVVVSDRTLRDLAARKPRSLAEMRDIYGIGEHKLAIYGGHLLQVILDAPD